MPPIIPILDAQACNRRAGLRVQPPKLQGDEDELATLIAEIAREIRLPYGPLDADLPVEAWLRSLSVDAGDVAELVMAAELGCQGEVAAQIAFDVMRLRLPDTDIFVHMQAPLPAPLIPMV
ncbi:MAG: hypothetical protein JNJ71_08380 [Rubrivivax sp.]|nr:hypothetical protein [Rubrivivax sp.]